MDLPHIIERTEIFRLHLKKVRRDPENFDIEQFAELTEGFVGAEIEQVIKEALYIAFSDNQRVLSDKDIIQAIQKTKPLSKTKSEMISFLQEKVQNHEVVSASKKITIKRKKKVIHPIELVDRNREKYNIKIEEN